MQPLHKKQKNKKTKQLRYEIHYNVKKQSIGSSLTIKTRKLKIKNLHDKIIQFLVTVHKMFKNEFFGAHLDFFELRTFPWSPSKV